MTQTHASQAERPASERAFDSVASLYDAWFDVPLGKTVDALEMELLCELATPRSGERMLDVGTGTGHSSFDLAARGLEVVAVDLSATMLAAARQKGADR